MISSARIQQSVPALWAIFLAVIVNSIITVEWSFPYCNDPQDGPAHAAFGFPLPYTQYSGVSSMAYLFMPAAYAFNMAFLIIVFFLCARGVQLAVLRSSPRWNRIFFCIALVLAIGAVSIELLKAGTIYAFAVQSIGDTYHPSLSYRPVGVSSDMQYDCRPSEFWFGRIAPH